MFLVGLCAVLMVWLTDPFARQDLRNLPFLNGKAALGRDQTVWLLPVLAWSFAGLLLGLAAWGRIAGGRRGTFLTTMVVASFLVLLLGHGDQAPIGLRPAFYPLAWSDHLTEPLAKWAIGLPQSTNTTFMLLG
jgi:hypothetical protein